jgi:hypothetical protein
VTVAGERAVNPNTASPEVLLAVVGDGRVVERILAARAHGPLDDAAIDVLADDFPDGTRALLMPRGQRYGVRAVAAVGDLRRGVEATVWVPAGLPPAVVAWRPFVPDPEEQG